ncbi:hypothetical protein EV188_114130 [Actinomycetospora succinea]|uniref:Uncharacterized protein n=1 Tax=Actinomycetospora succinea TaxID=663603 RepID=A0A4R6UKE0_9PSEU|nr:hypothetical protein [Actinomycetospora succinea]TDQ47042.1 hypothetical protein EV188_114130 [Actinomycetospora succinea]
MDEDAWRPAEPGHAGGTARPDGEPDPGSPPIPPPRERRRYRPLRGMEELVDDFLG